MEWQGIAQCAFEVCVGFYAADLISGVVHMYLDYQNVQDKRLRLHVENSIPAVVKVSKLSITKGGKGGGGVGGEGVVSVPEGSSVANNTFLLLFFFLPFTNVLHEYPLLSNKHCFHNLPPSTPVRRK